MWARRPTAQDPPRQRGRHDAEGLRRIHRVGGPAYSAWKATLVDPARTDDLAERIRYVSPEVVDLGGTDTVLLCAARDLNPNPLLGASADVIPLLPATPRRAA